MVFPVSLRRAKISLFWLMLGLLTAMSLAPDAQAVLQSEADVKADLKQINAQIKATEKTLKKVQKDYSAAQKRLRKVERRLATNVRERKQTQDDIEETRAAIVALRDQHRELKKKKDHLSHAVATDIRRHYMQGENSHLKLVLHEQHPENIARLLRYSDYLNSAKEKRYQEYTDVQQQLTESAVAAEAKERKLASLQGKLQQQGKALKRDRKERKLTLARLDESVKKSQSELAQLKKDKEALEEVLETLEKRALKTDGRPFAERKGQLEWPVSGRALKRFGAPKSGGLRWNGTVIAAKEGTVVKAIHEGRVVFADWLRGYGMLVIVDHGSGYLSLYGYNETVLKKVGDQVQAGDAIATVGRSGGQAKSALYFEIRNNRKPIDPRAWCRR